MGATRDYGSGYLLEILRATELEQRLETKSVDWLVPPWDSMLEGLLVVELAGESVNLLGFVWGRGMVVRL